MSNYQPPPNAPEPVDLMYAVALLLDARHDTSDGLTAREQLVPVLGEMVAELGILRDTVAAYREDLGEMRAQLAAERGTEVQWGIRLHIVDEDGHRGCHVLTGYTENGARYRAKAEFEHAEAVFRHLGEWQSAPDIAEADHADA
jgi:hypothetical protein